MRKIQKSSEFEMDEKGLKKLADLLKELRGTKSYEEVARDTGIIVTNIKNLESEQIKKPNMYILKALAEYYEVNPFKFYDFMGLYKEEEAAEYFKDIFAEEQFLKIPLYENYIDLCDRKNKIASKEVKKSIIEESLEKYKFQGTYTFMGIISENKFHIYIPLDGNKNITPVKFIRDHNLNLETSLLISETREIAAGNKEVLKKNEELISDGYVLEVTENFILGNIKTFGKEQLYLSTKEQKWEILNSMQPVEAVKIWEIALNKII